MRHDHFAAGKSIQSEANIRLENGRTGRTRTERLRARDGAKHRDSERERAASLATLHVRTRERERERVPHLLIFTPPVARSCWAVHNTASLCLYVCW